jgi:hypothetical protein
MDWELAVINVTIVVFVVVLAWMRIDLTFKKQLSLSGWQWWAFVGLLMVFGLISGYVRLAAPRSWRQSPDSVLLQCVAGVVILFVLWLRKK